MRRLAIGLIAIVLLLIAVVLQIGQWEDPNAADLESACLRIGAVMAVIWLAYEHLHRVPTWLWFSLPVLLFALARRPQWLLFLVPLVIALAILRPKKR
jgi:uncharacterized protein with PQ loop repeat